MRMKLNYDLANIKQPQQIYLISTSNPHDDIFIGNPDLNCSSKDTGDTNQRAPSWVSLRHACVEHNQDENGCDLLWSMLGGPTRTHSELLI